MKQFQYPTGLRNDPFFLASNHAPPYASIDMYHHLPGASHVVLVVNNPPADVGVTEMRVQSLGWKVPLEYEMATCPNIFAWEIPWREELVHGTTESDTTEQLSVQHLLMFIYNQILLYH